MTTDQDSTDGAQPVPANPEEARAQLAHEIFTIEETVYAAEAAAAAAFVLAERCTGPTRDGEEKALMWVASEAERAAAELARWWQRLFELSHAAKLREAGHG